MWLGAIYCTVFVAVAVWIGLMLFTRRSGRQHWSERYLHRLRHELEAAAPDGRVPKTKGGVPAPPMFSRGGDLRWP